MAELIEFARSPVGGHVRYRRLCDGDLEYCLKSEGGNAEEIWKVEEHQAGSTCSYIPKRYVHYYDLPPKIQEAIQAERKKRDLPPLE